MKPILLLSWLCVSCAFGAEVRVDQAEWEALQLRVQQLEAQLRALTEQLRPDKLGGTAPPSTTASPVPKLQSTDASVTSISDRGYAFTSVDEVNVLRVRGLVHLDARNYMGEQGAQGTDTLVLRRARVIIDGRLAKRYTHLFATEFGGNSVSILDANFGVALTPEVAFKAGRFKTPVGLEILQPAAATTFPERTLVSGLLPNRDLGLQLEGKLGAGRAEYAIGVFNGVADGGASANTDFDAGRHYEGRLMVRPFARQTSLLRGLALGAGGGGGETRSAAGRTAGYRTDGQQVYFAYRPSVTADGDAWRIVPQLEYRSGSFGLLAEYAVSSVELRAPTLASTERIQHSGWQTTATYLLTGEKSTYGLVAPERDFDPAVGRWGAFELVGRYANLEIDDDAFPHFAVPQQSASRASAAGLGLKWYLSKSAMFSVNYSQTNFTVDGATPFALPPALLRSGERVVTSRFQLAF